MNGTESSQFDLSSIVQVNTKRNQSYKGDILGIAIGGMIGFGASSIAPGIDSSTTTFRRIFTTCFCAGI